MSLLLPWMVDVRCPCPPGHVEDRRPVAQMQNGVIVASSTAAVQCIQRLDTMRCAHGSARPIRTGIRSRYPAGVA